MDEESEKKKALSKLLKHRQKGEETDQIPVEIRPNLYLGSIYAFKNHEFIKKTQITHILSVAAGSGQPPEDVVHLLIPLVDLPEERLDLALPQCLSFIEQALKSNGKKVLVHCMAGKSRSASVIVAYLMKKEGLTFAQAFAEVAKLRPAVCLNLGYAAQLRLFEKELAKQKDDGQNS